LRDDGSPDSGLPGFARLRVHGYWTLGGGKISKSVGNVVEALALTRKYGNDAFRYFVLREMPFGQDANFTEEAFVERLNADLANDLGNLVSRATTMLANFGHRAAGTPAALEDADHAIHRAAGATRDAVGEALDRFAFQGALVEIWRFIGEVNRYVDAAQPWALAKDPAKQTRLAAVLVTLAESLRYLGIVLEPFLPDAAARIRATIGDARPPVLANAVVDRVPELRPVARLSGLFPRIDTKAPASPAPTGARQAEGAAAAARITIDEFKRLDLRIAEVVAAEAVPKSKKLLKLTVRLADETRTVVAGIAEHYRPEALVGRKVVVVANLEPATLMGVTSNGMVLAGSAADTLALLAPDQDLPPGAKVR
jgi:methionyl-tRNA synthetase